MKFRCAVTGANGYLGSILSSRIKDLNIEVIPLTRGGKDPFNLKDGLEAKYFSSNNINCLIHCAWDFNIADDDEYQLTNLGGTVKLFNAAKEAGVEKMIFISSMSAFENCRSRYGITKRNAEIFLMSMGVIVVRPGLVYGDKLRGMLGTFSRLAKTSPIIPVVGDGKYIQYATHEDDLANLVKEIILLDRTVKDCLIVAASSKGRSLREIFNGLAGSSRSLIFIPVPWRFIWLFLKITEKINLNLPLKSDSLIGLVFSDERPNFEGLKLFKTKFRPFLAGECEK